MTDDPEPVPEGHWEVYLASVHQVSRAGVSGAAPFVDANFGAGPDLQLHALVPLAYERPSGGPTSFGVGDLELGVKLRFVQEGDARPMVGVYPAFDFPTGDATKGLGAGHWRAFVPVWLMKSFGMWTSFAGAGYWIDRGAGRESSWYAGATLVRRLADHVSAGAELFEQTAAQVGDRNNFGFNLGLTLDVNEVDHLLLSAGRSLVGDSQLQAYVGWQLTI
ncbi:MAG TPA: transporter [Polyangia bacterium]|nr:transporter [Polyangia bacterium]